MNDDNIIYYSASASMDGSLIELFSDNSLEINGSFPTYEEFKALASLVFKSSFLADLIYFLFPKLFANMSFSVVLVTSLIKTPYPALNFNYPTFPLRVL